MSTTASADPAISRFLGFKFKEGTTDEQKTNAIKGLFKLYENLARYVNEGPVGALKLKQYSDSGRLHDQCRWQKPRSRPKQKV